MDAYSAAFTNEWYLLVGRHPDESLSGVVESRRLLLKRIPLGGKVERSFDLPEY
jgi:hypothetical protein